MTLDVVMSEAVVFTLAALTVLGVGAVLLAERASARWVVVITKPLASLGFVGIALVRVNLGEAYDLWILAGLGFGWLGDVLLIPKGKRWFLFGLVNFLLGHFAYVVAFATLPLDVRLAWPASTLATAAAAVVLGWLWPGIPRGLRGPVLAYVGVISTMLILATAATSAGAPWMIGSGAALFYVSDLFVARERFVKPGFSNRLVGLPTYYAGQILLALTI